jgi:hypothetical protein
VAFKIETDFLNTSETLLNDFHLKAPEVLGREVERCEALMLKAMPAKERDWLDTVSNL